MQRKEQEWTKNKQRKKKLAYYEENRCVQIILKMLLLEASFIFVQLQLFCLLYCKVCATVIEKSLHHFTKFQ